MNDDSFTVGAITVVRHDNDDDQTWTWEWTRPSLPDHLLQVEYARPAGRWHYATARPGEGWAISPLNWPGVRSLAEAEGHVRTMIEKEPQ